MLTLKLKIKSCSNNELMSSYISSYTGAFYKLYNNAELIEDSYFLKSLRTDFNLSVHMLNSLKIDVKTKLNQYLTQQKKKTKQIQELEKRLKFEIFKNKKVQYKCFNKLAELKRNLNKNITFGSKELQKQITKLSQTIQFKNPTNKEELQKRLISLKEEFKSKRKIPYYIVGKAHFKSNENINFDLRNQKIEFKPDRKTKIQFEFNCGRNQQMILNVLQNQSVNCLLPITVSISKDYIYLNYDESKLNGTAFDKNCLKSEQKKSISKIQSKEISDRLKEEHKQFLKSNKIENRVASIDLNPNYIGFSITDYDLNGNQKFIYKTSFDLKILNIKTGKSSVDNSKQENKRKFEICQIYKEISKLCKHYKVFKFIIEDLNFKSKVEVNSKEFNRQTKNIWNRNLQTQLVEKYCNILGIELVKVSPEYTSFIGNMVYPFFDPISSSIEIGRRGFYQYQKGIKIYNLEGRINQEKLFYLLGENVPSLNCKSLFYKIKYLDYRNRCSNSEHFKSNKSKICLTT